MAKGTIYKRNQVKRKPGHLYYIDSEGNIRETKMQRGSKRGRRTCTSSNKSRKRTSRRKK